MLDGELIASKGEDVESKLLSDRKSGKEGPATDVISDCFLQIILGMQLRTIGESQLVNVENLLDTMPAIGVDFRASMNGPIIAFDRGYGKVSFIFSEHPFVGTTAIDAFKKKVRVTHPHLDIEAIDNLLQDNNIPDFVIQDIDSILLGPEVKVARLINDHLFHAVAIRDIYDKKIAQKILHFFLHGFPDLVFFEVLDYCSKKE